MAARRPRYWRDAATLILASRSHQQTTTKLLVSQPESKSQPEHSTFIYDYTVLMLKRSASSSFMPSAYVFPGGVADKSDFNQEWLDLFQEHSGQSIYDLRSFFTINGHRPPLISDHESFSSIPADIGFRICAIRETFEESGLLLAFQPHKNANATTSPFDQTELDAWRSEVDKDSSKFLAMCKHFKVVPNIWMLTEWSNWLTPVGKKLEAPPVKPHRFDTVFYLCCVDASDMTKVASDEGETHEPQWMAPGQFIEMGGFDDDSRGIKLMGPQLYELGRLARYELLEDLKDYSVKRSKLGTERWMSVHAVCKDGYLSLLPGDELYPKDADYEGITEGWAISFDQTCAEDADDGLKCKLGVV